MTKTPFTVIVPTIAETQLTGFIGAAERTIYGHPWRIEWWSNEQARILRDGNRLSVGDISKRDIRSVKNLLVASHAFFSRAA